MTLKTLSAITFTYGINKGSEFGLRTGTKDFRTGFYKGEVRAKAGMMVQDRPTRPFFHVLGEIESLDGSTSLMRIMIFMVICLENIAAFSMDGDCT